MTETLALDRPHAGTIVLSLNRPERLNAINAVMRNELTDTLAEIATDASVNVVVLTGAGRGFCSGIDMRNFGPGMLEASDPAIDRLRFQEAMAALPQAIRDAAATRDRRGQRSVRRRRLCDVPGRRHPNLLDRRNIRQRGDPAGVVGRRDGDELSPAPDRRHQCGRRLDADRAYGVRRRKPIVRGLVSELVEPDRLGRPGPRIGRAHRRIDAASACN